MSNYRHLELEQRRRQPCPHPLRQIDEVAHAFERLQQAVDVVPPRRIRLHQSPGEQQCHFEQVVLDAFAHEQHFAFGLVHLAHEVDHVIPALDGVEAFQLALNAAKQGAPRRALRF